MFVVVFSLFKDFPTHLALIKFPCMNHLDMIVNVASLLKIFSTKYEWLNFHYNENPTMGLSEWGWVGWQTTLLLQDTELQEVGAVRIEDAYYDGTEMEDDSDALLQVLYKQQYFIT